MDMIKIVAVKSLAVTRLGAVGLALRVPFDVSTCNCVRNSPKRGAVHQATSGSSADEESRSKRWRFDWGAAKAHARAGGQAAAAAAVDGG